MSEAREPRIDRLGRAAFISTVVASNRFTDELDRLCRTEGLSHPQYTALWVLCLAETPEGLPMGALVDGLLHRKADATRLVDRLLEQGYVTRTAAPHDRRRVLVAPTPAGREVFERLTTKIKALHRRQWAALDADELAQLITLLNKALWSHSQEPERSDAGDAPGAPDARRRRVGSGGGAGR